MAEKLITCAIVCFIGCFIFIRAMQEGDFIDDISFENYTKWQKIIGSSIVSAMLTVCLTGMLALLMTIFKA